MANQFYKKGAEKILTAAINFSSDTIKAVLVSSDYTANYAADEFYSTISADVLNSAQTLGSKSITAGVFDAADVTFTAVMAGDTAKAVVLYKDTGVAGTSPLLAYIDVLTGFPMSTNGGDIVIQWDNGASKIVALA
jgi:hypothetical protein